MPQPQHRLERGEWGAVAMDAPTHSPAVAQHAPVPTPCVTQFSATSSPQQFACPPAPGQSYPDTVQQVLSVSLSRIAQSASAQSVCPSQSLSMPSVQLVSAPHCVLQTSPASTQFDGFGQQFPVPTPSVIQFSNASSPQQLSCPPAPGHVWPEVVQHALSVSLSNAAQSGSAQSVSPSQSLSSPSVQLVSAAHSSLQTSPESTQSVAAGQQLLVPTPWVT